MSYLHYERRWRFICPRHFIGVRNKRRLFMVRSSRAKRALAGINNIQAQSLNECIMVQIFAVQTSLLMPLCKFNINLEP